MTHFWPQAAALAALPESPSRLSPATGISPRNLYRVLISTRSCLPFVADRIARRLLVPALLWAGILQPT